MTSFDRSTICGACELESLARDGKNFSGTIRLEPDVAEIFPDADAVNEALRFLIRVTQEKMPGLHDPKH